MNEDKIRQTRADNPVQEHVINIDKYFAVHVKIPLNLDIIEFKALSGKVNKLFSLSGAMIDMASDKAERFGIAEPAKPNSVTRTEPAMYSDDVTKDMISYIKSGKKAREILSLVNSKHGTTYAYNQINCRIYSIRRMIKQGKLE